MSEGWIKLHRKLQDNPIWTSEPFTRGQAWVDLILLANHEPGYIYVRDHKINLKRGDVGWSQNRLSKRWKWSRTKVRAFLNMLEKEQQVKQIKSRSYTVIRLLNYKEYQRKKQQEDKRKTTEKQQEDTNKNVKNVKNGKNEELYPFDDFWDDYGKKKGRAKCEQKWESIPQKDKKLIKEFIPIYKSSTEYQYQKYPESFLNAKIWKDDWDEYRSNGQELNLEHYL